MDSTRGVPCSLRTMDDSVMTAADAETSMPITIAGQ